MRGHGIGPGPGQGASCSGAELKQAAVGHAVHVARIRRWLLCGRGAAPGETVPVASGCALGAATLLPKRATSAHCGERARAKLDGLLAACEHACRWCLRVLLVIWRGPLNRPAQPHTRQRGSVLAVVRHVELGRFNMAGPSKR